MKNYIIDLTNWAIQSTGISSESYPIQVHEYFCDDLTW